MPSGLAGNCPLETLIGSLITSDDTVQNGSSHEALVPGFHCVWNSPVFTNKAIQSLRLSPALGGSDATPDAGQQTLDVQTAVLRPLSRLMIRTTNPTTNSKWIRPPPTCKLKPRTHKIRRTTKIVQSMSTSCARCVSTWTKSLLAGVTDHGQIRHRHVAALAGIFVYTVLLHLFLRVFLHPVRCGI